MVEQALGRPDPTIEDNTKERTTVDLGTAAKFRRGNMGGPRGWQRGPTAAVLALARTSGEVLRRQREAGAGGEGTERRGRCFRPSRPSGRRSGRGPYAKVLVCIGTSKFIFFSKI